MIIHGKKDQLIGTEHSIKLHKECNNCISELFLPEKMSHNEFDFYKHLIRPVGKFLSRIGFLTNPTVKIKFLKPEEIFYIDQDFERYFRRERMRNYKIKSKKNNDSP